MNDTIVTIDKAGRVVIPIRLRDALNLVAGDQLALESDDDKVTLRPVRVKARLRKKQGIWVYAGGTPITLEDTNRVLREIREERERRHLGLDE
jgi:AbrB family looped-hinge helix DNA binding protein